MGKTFLERFRRYEPSQEIRAILQSAGDVSLRIDKETRKAEVQCTFPAIVRKQILYRICTEIAQVYELTYFKIFPQYNSSLFSLTYLPDVLEEATHVGAITKGFFNEYQTELDGDCLKITVSSTNGGIDLLYRSNTPQVISDIIHSEFGLRYAVTICKEEHVPFDYAAYDQRQQQQLRTLMKQEQQLQQQQQQLPQAPVQGGMLAEREGGSTSLPLANSLLTQAPVCKCEENGMLTLGYLTFDIASAVPVLGEAFSILQPQPIRYLTDARRGVVALGEIVSLETRENRTKDKLIVSMGLTDRDSSIMVKAVLTREEADALLGALKRVKSSVKRGTVDLTFYKTGVAVRGDLRRDRFDGELVLTPREVMFLPLVPRQDTAQQKRVELHLHTNMSAMDATIAPDALVETIKNWGHAAVAVTDHGNAQAFPEMMLAAEKLGVKVIYGMEAYFVDDTARAVFCQQQAGPLSFDGEFCVFDIETTGLSNLRDRMTEIGAVRICDGEIVDQFDTFVDPQMPVPEKISELTGITDEMLRGAPQEEEALEAFLKFADGLPLVAHNASFDVGFIRRAAERVGCVFDLPYIDTVAMSKYCNPELKRHKLDVVAEYFGLGTFNHHRAQDDARMLARIFLCMAEKLRREGISDMAQLNAAMREHADPLQLKTYHQILLVKNQEGLKNLYRLISDSYLSYYRKHPRIPKTLLAQHRDGLLIGSACAAGELFQALLDNRPWDELKEIASFYDYLEIQPLCNNGYLLHEQKVSSAEDLKDLNRKIVRLGQECGKPVVATCDAHFLNCEDEIKRKILLYGMKYRDADRDVGIYLRNTEEMLAEFAYLGEQTAREVVITNTNRIADMIETVRPIPKGTYTPHMDGAEEELQKLCWDRAADWYGRDGVIPAIVSERLKKELDSIIQHGFAVLYMIAQRLVHKSNELGYMVGSRGSVGSSFVATMAGISEVNPLPPHYRCPKCRYSNFDQLPIAVGSGFDLPLMDCPICGTRLIADGHDIPFETFLGFYGDKSPDIDLNFSGMVQGKIHKYTEELFGSENVFRAGTIGTLASKTAYGFIARYMEEHGVTLNKAEIARLVNGCVGVKRTTGQHPGGIIVVPKEYSIYDFTPVQHPADAADSDIVTTHFQFSYLHDTILKLDELGHDMPTKLKILERYTGVPTKEVPMNDPDVYELFLSTKSLGIRPQDICGCPVGTYGLPEFGTKFVQQMIVDAKPKNFADLLQISGLSHGTDVWLGNAQDLIRDGVCTISEVIGTRDSIMLTLIGWGVEKSLSFKIMESVRKGKGLTAEMEAAMREKSVPEWYIASCKKIKYMFPKAHAAAYVMQAIQFAWYKVHYPLEFYAAYFTAAPGAFDAQIVLQGKSVVEQTTSLIRDKGNDATQKEKALLDDLLLIDESLARGVRYLPIDLYASDASAFLCEDGAIRVPFTSLPGLGLAAAEKIVEARSNGPFFSQLELQDRAKLSKSIMELLKNNGALRGMPQTNQLSLFDM